MHVTLTQATGEGGVPVFHGEVSTRKGRWGKLLGPRQEATLESQTKTASMFAFYSVSQALALSLRVPNPTQENGRMTPPDAPRGTWRFLISLSIKAKLHGAALRGVPKFTCL